MFTDAAQRTGDVPIKRTVASRPSLYALGVTQGELRARLAAGRWQTCGSAIVLHNSALSRREGWDVALINAGPRAALTAFTAAEASGLQGWLRDQIHLIAPMGTRRIVLPGLAVVIHRSRSWSPDAAPMRLRSQRLPGALVVAAATFRAERPACGILAAAVQQGLARPGELEQELLARTKTRHRRQLLLAISDIAGGSDSLSEIDFVRLCRKAGLPVPEQQKVRHDSDGRRRYLDATWRRADGRLVVVEVDGALHLAARSWWEDQLRQNEIALSDAIVLRFPSVVLRSEEGLVIAQLRRAIYD